MKSIVYGLKYHVPSQGITGQNQIWRIYQNVDKGWTETIYVEHIEIDKEVNSWTGNNLFRIGYGLILEANNLEVYTDDESGLKHARFSNE